MSNINHLAIIMDGNGRWAKEKSYPRSYGHLKGTEIVREIALHTNQIGIKKLTVFAFSTENVNRSSQEVAFIDKLPRMFFDKYLKELMEHDIKITYLGDLSIFSQDCQNAILDACQASQNNQGLNLNIAINYGARTSISKMLQSYASDCLLQQKLIDFNPQKYKQYIIDDVDLLIRTGKEKRISNFLLWEIAYAELFFSDSYWPDFNSSELDQIILDFKQRERRFGR